MSTQSRWMFHICTVYSVPIKIHGTFFLFLAWIMFTAPGGMADSLWITAFVLAVFLCVLLHECGHVFTARAFGIKTKDIVLYPFGGIAMLLAKPKPFAELIIAIAGPLVNIFIAGVIIAWLNFVPNLSMSLQFDDSINSFLLNLFRTNIFIALFNMIPAIPMDGGRILRAILDLLKIKKATLLAARISQGCSIVMGIVGIYSGSMMLTIISVLVFLGAMQEMISSHTQAVAEGKIAKDYAVETEKLYCFSHGTTLSDAIRIAIKTSQEYFPVIYHSRLIGIIDRNKLINNAASSEYDNEYLSGIMDREPTCYPEETSISTVLADANEKQFAVAATLNENQEFSGLIFIERVSELMVIDSIRDEKRKFLENYDESI